MAGFAGQAAWASYKAGAVNIKTLVTPEWWWLSPLPLVFVLLAIEMVFRMGRLARSERAPRADAVSARVTRGRPMSWQLAAWLMLGGSTLLLFIGMPVALTFIAINIVGACLYMGGEVAWRSSRARSVISLTSFSLTPIPLFVLMGEILFHTGLALKVIDGVERLITRIPGRLAVVAVVSGTVFSAISGSTIATTAMLGSLMLPVMLQRGYHPKLATGPIMAIGAVDMLIPPSALTVLLGSLSGISISKLLIGGVMPGLILSIAFVVWIVVRVRFTPSLAPPETDAVLHTGWARWRLFVLYVLPCLSIFGVVVGALVAGWATPTECAAVGAFATLVFAAAYRALTPAALMHALRGTAAISAMILFIILGATTFAQILSFSGASNGLVQTITGHGLQHRRHRGGDDGDADLSRHLRRPGQHDDDHAADLHAGGADPGHRSGVVRRDVPDLHAARPAAAAARPAADDDARRGAARR